MARATYEERMNNLIIRRQYKIPLVDGKFASTKAISRMSNGQGRKSTYWMDANPTMEEQIRVRTLSWVGWLLKWEVDHVVPVSKGGSYNIENLRLLPPRLNSFIGNSGEWPHNRLNEFVHDLGPKWREALGIPESFRSCSADEFFSWVDLSDLK